MNDDFLHRIRVEPPPGFMVSLKARLDRQLPPATPAPRRSMLRVLVFGLLFGGSVFAISLLTVNGLPQIARNLLQIPHQVGPATTDKTGHSDAPAGDPTRTVAPLSRARQSAAEAPGPAGQTSTPRPSGLANKTAQTVQSIGSGTSTGPRQVINVVTLKTLEAHIKSRTADFGRFTRLDRPEVAVTAADGAAEALAEFCSGSGAASGDKLAPPRIAAVPRRITRAEFEACTTNIGTIAEVPMEHQAVLLARSKLYGTLPLSARDIFLALAAEIPDPQNPGTLIMNPNTTWDRVNGSLPSEPIEVFGPPAQSMTGVLFRETLLEAGCNTFPAVAALKQSDRVRYEQFCRTLRRDSAYVEMREEAPADILQSLQSHPNAIGVLGYGELRLLESSFKDNFMLITNPIGGVQGTPETISNGAYPGSRTLYLYVYQQRAPSNAFALMTWIVEQSQYAPGSLCVVPIDAGQMKAMRKYPLTLPDLKM